MHKDTDDTDEAVTTLKAKLYKLSCWYLKLLWYEAATTFGSQCCSACDEAVINLHSQSLSNGDDAVINLYSQSLCNGYAVINLHSQSLSYGDEVVTNLDNKSFIGVKLRLTFTAKIL